MLSLASVAAVHQERKKEFYACINYTQTMYVLELHSCPAR